MIGLRSNFGPSLVLVGVVFLVSVVGAAVAARRAAAGHAPLRAAAQALTAGAVAVTVLATALPRRLAIETDGDLVLRLGGGGLGDWSVLFDDPASLAAVQLVSNVLLYAAVACTMTVGWYRRRRYVVPACLALSIMIEAAQYSVLGRVAALDDVVLNGAGAVVGWLAATALVRSGRIEVEGSATP